MSYAIRIDPLAQREIDEFAHRMGEFDEDFAAEQLDRLDRVFRDTIAPSPTRWSYFFITGAPYHAYLFKVGRRTSYWIVYNVDEDENVVRILRFWSSNRDDRQFGH
jgi:mRNA-degrading endonuclease RelE of RelBE toxin-antitoxin system